MNSEAVKEIVLKVNGDYAERELKKIQQNIVKARKEKEAFLKNAPDASSWTKEQEKQWRESTPPSEKDNASSRNGATAPTK